MEQQARAWIAQRERIAQAQAELANSGDRPAMSMKQVATSVDALPEPLQQEVLRQMALVKD
jgi:hypothetical protein